MNKAVLLSIQPYYVFLIIADTMGWKIPQGKTLEVRKDFPQSKDWDKQTVIYCSKNRQSFNRIPKEYQPLMAPLLGKVVGKFVCDIIEEFHEWQLTPYGKFRDSEEEDLQKFLKDSCLSRGEVFEYRKNLEYYKPLYGWHISELKIYDEPKELNQFKHPCFDCGYQTLGWESIACDHCSNCHLMTRSPQSWCYVAEV